MVGKLLTSGELLNTSGNLVLTPAGLLTYDRYWSRHNFGYAQLTDVEVVHRLLSFDDDLSQAYRYYQDLILVVKIR